VMAEAKIVVVAERDEPASTAHHGHAIDTFGRLQLPPQPACIKPGELLRRERFDRFRIGGHRVVSFEWEKPYPLRQAASMSEGTAMSEPVWLAEGLEHIWLPYAQMKTAPRPVAVRATHGSRIVLED